jgi:glutathione S-transferase
VATGAVNASDMPVLWHLKVSHYNEKARWALDYKGVTHVRRAAVPGRHIAIAEKLTGSRTFPVLVIDGEAIGDSTRIIAALEDRYPDPPLYPADPDDRRRALELEDYFDEELGPYTRRLAVHRMLPEREILVGAFFQDVTGLRGRALSAAYPAIRQRMSSMLEIDDRTVPEAFDKLRQAGERFQTDLQPSGYLVGERFTVADLTLAALLSPLVAPEQFPYPQPQRGHPSFAPLREALAENGLADWTRDMYSRHRGQSAEVR